MIGLAAAWKLARVFGPLVIATIFFGLWQSSSHEVAKQKYIVVRVTGERDELVAVITDATVKADKNGVRIPLSVIDALAAQRGIIRDRDSKDAALVKVDAATKANAATDLAAKQTRQFSQAANEQQRARNAPIIRKLEATKATGDAVKDDAALDAASRAAWELGK